MTRGVRLIDERMGTLKRDFLPPTSSRRSGRRAARAWRCRPGSRWAETARLLDWPTAIRSWRRRGLGGPVLAGGPRPARARREAQARGRPAHRPRRARRPVPAAGLRPRGIARLEEFGLAYASSSIRVTFRSPPSSSRGFPRRRCVHRSTRQAGGGPGEIREWSRGLRALAAAPNVTSHRAGDRGDWSVWTSARCGASASVSASAPARLMIGSDWPVCTLAADYGRTMAVVTDYLRSARGGARRGRCWAGTRSGSGTSR
jgi:L-fuconolactonase